MFNIAIDDVRRRVDVSISAVFDTGASRQFEAEIRAAAVRLGARGGGFDMIVDISAGVVASAETSGMLAALLPELTRLGLRRSAGITGSALVGLQASRITARDERFRTFATRDEALGWIEA